jgi:hypothetical protein
VLADSGEERLLPSRLDAINSTVIVHATHEIVGDADIEGAADATGEDADVAAACPH